MNGHRNGEAASPPLLANWRKLARFEEFRLLPGSSVATFLGEWEDRLGSAMEAGCLYSDMVLAFKLLERLHLTEEAVAEVLREVGQEEDSQDSLVSQVGCWQSLERSDLHYFNVLHIIQYPVLKMTIFSEIFRSVGNFSGKNI